MEQDVDGLRAELAELRAEMAEMRSTQHGGEAARVSRRRLLTGLAGLGAAGAASAVGVATASPAGAADGDNLVLGEDNVATTPTTLSVSLDQAIEPENAVRIVMHDPSEPVTLDDPPHPALLVESAVTGVTGYGRFNGLHGVTDTGVGVYAESLETGGVALEARSVTGPAAWLASGDGVTLRLTPSTVTGPPAATNSTTGDISVDQIGQPWLCIVGGTPGTWTQLLREDTAHGRTVPINPIRAIDTRAPGGRPTGAPAVPGQKAGPLNGGTSLTLDLAGIASIPATATGVIGNLTAISPTFSGYLAARPSGSTGTTTSSLNFPRGVTAIANAFTSRLGPDGLTITGSGNSANTYHLVVDITAYIT